jgi:glycosyltransferase involved in cell wall biosynthesis
VSAVSVVVPARDAQSTLARCLDALGAQTVAAEVIVVDNGSRDGTAALAEAHPAVSRVIRRERGAGPGAARNDGVGASSAPAIAFTDADCVPVPTWLDAGLAALDSCDLLQGRVDPDPAGARHPFEHTVSVTSAWGFYETANLLVRREWFDRVGGFGAGIDADGRPFAEDVLFGWAIRRAGGRTGFSDDALVHHAVFERGWRGFVAERARLRHFPALVRAVPELRDTFLRHRVFLTQRTLLTDSALLGVASRRRAGLLAAVPYAIDLHRRVRHWPQHPPLPLAAAFVAADVRGAAALAAGSIRDRTVVL